MLVLFCAEGNNIPEGTSMVQAYSSSTGPSSTSQRLVTFLHLTLTQASYAASALNLSHAGEWRAPPSWATLFAQPPVETSLFM